MNVAAKHAISCSNNSAFILSIEVHSYPQTSGCYDAKHPGVIVYNIRVFSWLNYYLLIGKLYVIVCKRYVL